MGLKALEVNGLSVGILTSLSYQSHLGISLKRTLKHFDKDKLIAELTYINMCYAFNDELLNVALDYRVKSVSSMLRKYDRYYGSNRQCREVFNDVLGFRAMCSDYDEVLNLKAEHFSVADMSKGKASDDGYRGVHVYFQLSSSHYPIEIQFNTFYDRQMNDWLHDHLYKRPDISDELGAGLRKEYEGGNIKSKEEFSEVLNNVLSCSERL